MASAGTVVVDFAAEVARFQAQLKTVQTSLGRLETGFSKVGRAFKGFLGAGAAIAAITAITKATAESEAAIAQLDAALKNAGASVGLTSKRFQDFAAEMQHVTTFTDEAVIGVESILLSFKGLSGGTVLAATQAVLDLSTRLKVDLTSAAKLVGKALADPEKGMTALARAGVVFTEEQRDVIKTLVDTGRAAEAQTFILQQLEARFGGAAAAARNTFGGALIGVSNAFGELLEAKSGMPAVTSELNKIADVLSDPATKAGFDKFLEFLARTAAVGLQAAASIGSLVSVVSSLAAEFEKRFPGIDKVLEFLEKAAINAIPGAAGIRVITDALRELQELEKFRNTSGRPGGFAAPAVALGESPGDSIDLDRLTSITAIETRISALRSELAFKEMERLTAEIEDQERLRQESADRILNLETSISEQRSRIAFDEFNANARFLEDRVRQEQDVQDRIKAIKLGAINDAIGFLQLLGARSKTAAKAAFIVQKGIAIAETIIATQAAAAKALQFYGPTPAGYAAAASAIAFGAARVGIIAATAIEGVNQISSGARLGTPANPVFTNTQQGDQPTFGASSQNVVQVIFNGPVAGEDAFLELIREAVDGRDVIVFSPDSLQAQLIRDGG